MRRRIFALFLALMYFYSTVAQAFVPPTPVGVEIAQVMASRGAVTGLSRVFSGLGPVGLLASILIPVAYSWVMQPDGKVQIPGGVIPDESDLPEEFCYTHNAHNDCYGSKESAMRARVEDTDQNKYKLGGSAGTNSWQILICNRYTGPDCSFIAKVNREYRNGRALMAPVKTAVATKTLADAIKDLPESEKVKPIPAAQVAAAVNQVWYDAAIQPGYSGPTYSPVTEAQVQAVRTATGTSATVGHLASEIGFPDPATVSNPIPKPPENPDPKPFPNDYSREVTQQAVLATQKASLATQQEVLRALDGSGVPNGSAIDKESDLARVASQNTSARGAIDGITPQSLNLPSSWFPSIPTAACVNPTVPNPVTGAQVPVEICGSVDVLSKFISGVVCFFVLIGSVRQVQSALRA